LTIAKECNDQAGQRRAHGNLGNAYLYLEDFDKSLHHYREAMNIGELMNDESFIAKMNFTIGRVYSLKQDYDTAIYFHEKHLNLARQLEDSIGQCRAYYFLSQLNEKINQNEKAKKYDSLYKALAREVIIYLFHLSYLINIFRLKNQQKMQFQCQLDLDQQIICSKFILKFSLFLN